MEKYKYIYGASVQGIQGFIFSTNSLKDIVGGSELVEKICTSLFSSRYLQGATQIIGAAGNIKCVYDDPVKCQKTVLEFPKTVMQEAPGITISQAVVKVTEEEFKARGVNIVIYANQLTRTGFPAMQNAAKLILKNQMMRKNGKMKFLRRNPKNIIFLVERKSLLRKKKVE